MHPTDEVMPADLDYRAAAAEVRCSRMAIVAAVLLGFFFKLLGLGVRPL